MEDGRRITIETGQEDREIVLVTAGGLVLYRVNDVIYEARIDGRALTVPELFVKDGNTPEIHWAFIPE